jgi:hypothetical protein
MTAIICNDEICEMREMSLDGEMSFGDLDQVAGGFLPLAVVGAIAGVAVVSVAAAAVGVYLGVKLYEATSGNHVSLTIS